MPTHIKIIVSLVTLVVGGMFYLFEHYYGETVLGWVGGGLSLFMVMAMWLFREPGQRR